LPARRHDDPIQDEDSEEWEELGEEEDDDDENCSEEEVNAANKLATPSSEAMRI
jgi:hypothetical protein